MTQMYLDDRDLQNYGPDLINFTTRAAAQAVEPRLAQLDQQNNELRWQIARETRARLDRQLEAEIPNYLEIDSDPRWLTWLRGHDSLSGYNRQEMLDRAIADGDIRRVVAMFQAFMAAYLDPGQPDKARTRTASARAPTANVYTRDQIRKLYDAHRKGGFVGREDEWRRIEADIIRAGAEGRVTGAIVDLGGK